MLGKPVLWSDTEPFGKHKALLPIAELPNTSWLLMPWTTTPTVVATVGEPKRSPDGIPVVLTCELVVTLTVPTSALVGTPMKLAPMLVVRLEYPTCSEDTPATGLIIADPME